MFHPEAQIPLSVLSFCPTRPLIFIASLTQKQEWPTETQPIPQAVQSYCGLLPGSQEAPSLN
jgi:hypothetical protein